MSIFEERGIELQYNATSKTNAIKSFQTSCTICCRTGKHIECDRCNIAFVHNLIIHNFKH